jgi:hypothetical protein
LVALSLGAAPIVAVQAPATASPGVAAMKTAFAAAYNLDYDEAIALGRQAVALEPGNSRLHRGLASIIWQHILFKRGAVSVDYYLGSVTRSNKNLPKPDPASAAEFKREIDRAIDLATARMRKNPKDLQAKFDAGSAYGLQASYVASVEGTGKSAFGIARRAYTTQQDVLEQDPSRVAAGVVVGTYRYIASTLNLGKRMLLFFAGMGSDREEGIALLEAATRDPEARVDASAALMLVYSREGRHAEVVSMTRVLGTEFPRNRLLQLEEGARRFPPKKPSGTTSAAWQD